MKLKSVPVYVSLAILLSLTGCGSGNNATSTSQAGTGTGSNDCDIATRYFNEDAGMIIRDLSNVNRRWGNIPDDLKTAYPSARDAWNSALRQVKNNYSSSFTPSSLQPLSNVQLSRWREANLQDYQRFFLLLTEYSDGPHNPTSSGAADWAIGADATKRLSTAITKLNNVCAGINSQSIRSTINPIPLPEKIEDCLK